MPKLKVRLYGTALKVRLTTGWVRLSGFACLRTVWPRVSCTDSPGGPPRLPLARLFREFFDFTNEPPGNCFAGPVQTEFKARAGEKEHRVKGQQGGRGGGGGRGRKGWEKAKRRQPPLENRRRNKSVHGDVWSVESPCN